MPAQAQPLALPPALPVTSSRPLNLLRGWERSRQGDFPAARQGWKHQVLQKGLVVLLSMLH